MNKYLILTALLLVSVSFSTLSMAQKNIPTVDKTVDVAQLLYPIIKQQLVVKKAYKDLIAASDNYIDDPNDTNLKAFQAALANDLKATQQYNKLIANVNEADIQKAEKKYYEETPATKAEIESGPIGKGTPPSGESVESEIPIPPPMLVQKLKEEVKASGGSHSPFAEQLKEQQKKVKRYKS